MNATQRIIGEFQRRDIAPLAVLINGGIKRLNATGESKTGEIRFLVLHRQQMQPRGHQILLRGSPNRNWHGVCSILIFMTLLLMIVNNLGCARSYFKPTVKTLSGIYEGSYLGGTRTFILKPDGTYTQDCVNKGKKMYENTGTWSVNGDSVTFMNFVSDVNLDKGIHLAKPMRYGSVQGSLDTTHYSIYFNEDLSILITKKE